jgi:hypothetical protein
MSSLKFFALAPSTQSACEDIDGQAISLTKIS